MKPIQLHLIVESTLFGGANSFLYLCRAVAVVRMGKTYQLPL